MFFDFTICFFLNLVSLVGQSAPPEVLQKLTYLVTRHPQVKRVDTVRAYTFGVLYFVEVSSENIYELTKYYIFNDFASFEFRFLK